MPALPDSLRTPQLLIRLDLVGANLRRMQELLGGDLARWQPHVKSAKAPAIFAEMLDFGIRHYKCATVREARFLLQTANQQKQTVDLVIAINLSGQNLRDLADLAEHHPQHTLALLTESPEHAADIVRKHPYLKLWIDLDPGNHRSGIPLNQPERIRATAEAAGKSLAGLHFYEGQVTDTCPEKRKQKCTALYDQLMKVHERLSQPDRPLPLLTSGTPSFEAALDYPAFQNIPHRVGPGTVVFWDQTSEEYGIEGFQFAATVATRVISRPTDQHFTCDAGSKAIDAACGDPVGIIVNHPNWLAQNPNEEHLPFFAPQSDAPSAGTLLEIRPRHVCPTVNLAEEALLLEGNRIIGLTSVASRAHDAGPCPETSGNLPG